MAIGYDVITVAFPCSHASSIDPDVVGGSCSGMLRVGVAFSSIIEVGVGAFPVSSIVPWIFQCFAWYFLMVCCYKSLVVGAVMMFDTYS